MTCIVGLESRRLGKVFIGGDLQGTGGNHTIVHTQPKVFTINGVAFGYTTSYRFGQVIEHHLHEIITPDKDDVYPWLVQKLVPDVRKALKDYADGGKITMLVGVCGELWEYQADHSVLRPVRGFASCGSGQEYALGAMRSLLRTPTNRTNPDTTSGCKELVGKSIEAAADFSPTVGADCHIVTA